MLTNLYFHLSIYRLDNWIRIDLFFPSPDQQQSVFKNGKDHISPSYLQSYRNSITKRKFDRKSFWIYSSGVKKSNTYLCCCIMIYWMIQFHVWITKKSFSGSIEMKLSWPPGWGQETQMPLQPNLTSCLNTLCVFYLLWQQPLFLGEGGRNSCPLMAHSRVTVWKVHFDLWRRGFRSGQSSFPSPSWRLVSGCLTFQMTSGHCPCQSGFGCFDMFDFEQQQRSVAKYKHQVYISSRQEREQRVFFVWWRGAAALGGLLGGNCVHIWLQSCLLAFKTLLLSCLHFIDEKQTNVALHKSICKLQH